MKKAYIVVGLGFGDEGKGTIVDFITRSKNAEAVVKFNGGPQAAHNVHLPNGNHFTFSQFSSGSFSEARTFISKYVMIDPLAMLMEGKALSDLLGYNAFDLMNVDAQCEVITPYHKIYNREIEKSRGGDRHGSCGVGYGVAKEMSLSLAPVLRIYDLYSVVNVNVRIKKIKEYLINKAIEEGLSEKLFRGIAEESFIADTFVDFFYSIKIIEVLNKELEKYDTVVFEGAQGALLDELRGFNPYTTWSTTTNINAKAIIRKYENRVRLAVKTHTIGVMRTFSTRHGAGPFLAKSASYNKYSEDDDNCHNDWQTSFDSGYLDLVVLRYAFSYSNIDSIALTHYDKIQENFEYVYEYENEEFGPINGIEPPDIPNLRSSEQLTNVLLGCKPNLETYSSSIIEFVKENFSAELSILSFGKTYVDKSTLIDI